MNLGLKFLLCQKENVLASKGNQLSIANFQLQWKDACKTVGKSVSVMRMGTDRIFSASTRDNSHL